MNKWSTTKVVAFGFMGLILAGALILTLPLMSRDGQGKPLIDALFTATTSVCVTGLTTVPVASYSPAGQLVILLLIQFGGLGIVTVSMILIQTVVHRITLRERKLISESYGLNEMFDMSGFIRRVVTGTLCVELIGALLLGFRFVPQYGVLKGIWYSVFHAVSAFCNAGLDLLGETSYRCFLTDPLVNFTTIFLIFMGNIGFVVWWDLGRVFGEREFGLRHCVNRLKLHTKIVLLVSAVIYVVPVLLILLFEYNNPETIGNLTFGQKVMACMFEGATLRTAGFETFPQAAMTDSSGLLGLLLMYVGGSPVGTAGGTKTVPVALLFVLVISMIRGKKDPEVFHRRIPIDTIRASVLVVMLNVSFIIVGTLLILNTEGTAFRETLFEVTSAITTTGLTMGVCGNLSLAGKLVFVLCMFSGRIGALTLIMALRRNADDRRHYAFAEEKVLLG